MMTGWQTAITVGIFAIATFATRAAAFAVFPSGRPTPGFVLYLGRVLPYAITAMLVVYCLKDAHPLQAPYAAPEAIAVAVVAASYLLFKNSLLSIALGTVGYMLLVQLVFVA